MQSVPQAVEGSGRTYLSSIRLRAEGEREFRIWWCFGCFGVWALHERRCSALQAVVAARNMLAVDQAAHREHRSPSFGTAGVRFGASLLHRWRCTLSASGGPLRRSLGFFSQKTRLLVRRQANQGQNRVEDWGWVSQGSDSETRSSARAPGQAVGNYSRVVFVLWRKGVSRPKILSTERSLHEE